MSEKLENETEEVTEVEMTETTEEKVIEADVSEPQLDKEDEEEEEPLFTTQELLEQLNEAKKEIEGLSSDRDKWKHHARKNEEEKKALHLQQTRRQILDKYSLPREAIDLIGSGSVQELETRAKNLQSLLESSGKYEKDDAPTLTPTPLQGVPSETKSSNIDALYAQYLELANKEKNKTRK